MAHYEGIKFVGLAIEMPKDWRVSTSGRKLKR